MAFDGIVIHALTEELNELLCGGKIDKIHQPERSTVTVNIRTRDGGYRLLLCANPSCARVHLMTNSMENPASPPMFCMLLRKHLSGGKITLIEQPDFERIVRIHIENYDEMGYVSEKILICELMGKYSNIILVGKDDKIIDSIFHVDFTVSSVRQILPGLIYTSPPEQGKRNPLLCDKQEIKALLSENDVPLYKQLMDIFSGISPLMAREAVHRAVGRSDASGFDVTSEQLDKVGYVFYKLMRNLNEKMYSPCVVEDINSKKLLDFNAFEIGQYENLGSVKIFDTVNEAAENFYIKKSSMQNMKQKSADLTKFVNNKLERCARKLQIQNETLEKAKKRDRYKIYGDLITANIYRISRGMESIACENFYSEDNAVVEIPLKCELSPSQNAQKYYKRYTKEKTAEEETLRQRKLNLKEIDYLESVKEAIEVAENSSDISMIREELAEQGYLKKHNVRKSKSKITAAPLHFVSDDGYDIYVGKNNTQNDYVTLKLSRSTDIWFHTKGVHGSHVLVKTADAMAVPESTYLQAASLAAYYSKGRASLIVPVDYTEVKNVKKPSGAKPGMVIYFDYNTINARPDEELALRLKKQ